MGGERTALLEAVAAASEDFIAATATSLPPRELTTLADRKIKRRLEHIKGVAKAKLVGASTRLPDSST